MIVFLTTILILLCLLVILLILIQRTSGGMGSALGGGAADQVLGAGSAAQLSKFTVYGILGFFVLSFVLYAFYQTEANPSDQLIRSGGASKVDSSTELSPVGTAPAAPSSAGAATVDEKPLETETKSDGNGTE